METKEFFKTQTDSSRVKAKIVAEYFPQYCRIIMKHPQTEIRYLDLFAGPGKYEDGSPSTPLLIGQACAEDPMLRSIVHLMFNDIEYTEHLQQNFEEQFPQGTFHFPPRFGNKKVGEDIGVTEYLTKKISGKNPYPTLLFFDPWGYKGVDTRVLAEFMKPWGNEVFLFVNIKRIHAAIENEKFDDLMKALFPTRIDVLRRDRKYKASVQERLHLIMDNLSEEVVGLVKGKLYHCAFKFQEEDSNATSHYIIHFTKHSKGYELVKQVFYDYDNIGSTLEREGVYAFDAKKMAGSPTLDFGDSNIELLANKLLSEFAGKRISAAELHKQHQPTTLFSGSHYLKALRYLYDCEKITAEHIDSGNHKKAVLLTATCMIQF